MIPRPKLPQVPIFIKFGPLGPLQRPFESWPGVGPFSTSKSANLFRMQDECKRAAALSSFQVTQSCLPALFAQNMLYLQDLRVRVENGIHSILTKSKFS